MLSTSGVYGFFEDGYLDKDNEATIHLNYTFVCKYCKGKNIKPMTVRAKKGTTSNLIGHLRIQAHPHLYTEFINNKTTVSNKNKRCLNL